MIDVPRFGELFGFIGLSTPFRGKHYYSISTYDGDDLGVDGKPYHFCNALLEFDPQTQRFEFPSLETGRSIETESPPAYYQVSYTMATSNDFFATGSNIRQENGTLDQSKAGDCAFWQTLVPKPPR
jgi:hypothetical protein